MQVFEPEIMGHGNGPKLGGMWMLIVLAVVVLIGFKSFVYTVAPNEVAIVQRFGKFARIEGPGLHIKMPFPIEKATKILVDYVFKEEFGFRTVKADVRTVYSSKRYADESLMLTGDLNVLDVKWVVQFKIKDPKSFLFNVRDKRKNLRDVSESIMREIVGDYTFNEILTTKRLEISDLLKQRLQETLDRYTMGVQVLKILLQDVNPPDPVKPAFNDVNAAKQEKERMINEAWEEYNKIIPKEKGLAEKTIEQAKGYALEVVNNAQGDVARFKALLKEYNKAKEITRKRLYLESMQDVLSKIGKKFIVDKEEKSILPFMDLSKQQ